MKADHLPENEPGRDYYCLILRSSGLQERGLKEVKVKSSGLIQDLKWQRYCGEACVARPR